MTAPRAPSPPTGAGDAARERLLDVAERQFAERGFAETSIRSITTDAGCNVSAVSYYFGNKLGLYTAAIRRRLDGIREQRLLAIREATADLDETADGLDRLLRHFSGVFVAPLLDEGGAQLMSLFLREFVTPQLDPGFLIDEILEPVERALAEALAKVSPGLGPIDARLCAMSHVAQLGHVCHLREGNQGAAGVIDAVIDHVVRFTADGVRAAAARSARVTPAGEVS